MKKVLALVMAGLMILATLAFTACGNKNTKETIVVGYTDYAPMNYFTEDGTLVGFDTDLAKAVFEDLGYNVIFKEIEWDQKYTELESGTINCIWNGFTSNGDEEGVARSEFVDFSYDYMINKQVVVASKTLAASVNSVDDLATKIGSAEKGSVGYAYLEGFNFTEVEGQSQKKADASCVIIKDATSQLKALQDLKLGGCEFVVLDEQLAKAYVGVGEYTNYQIIETLSSDIEYYAIGFKKGSDLTAKVNATLEKFAANGKLVEIATKYQLQNAVVTSFNK